MPVIVVGADTELGEAIVERLLKPPREVRAFVTDEVAAQRMRERGVKVALGDVSDESHVEGAATRCFSAILVTEAASDGRERSFADSREAVIAGWANAVVTAKVQRVIWVGDGPRPQASAREVVSVDPDDPNVVETVVDLDDALTIG